MIFGQHLRACATLAALACALAPALAQAESRRPTAKAAASNPYFLVKRTTPAKATVIARWTEPPTFAIAPRTIGIMLDANYFARSAPAGASHRGHAYNVRRKSL
ncbi:MAG: hypothetical protein ABL901_04800 [Hyphomicrobiaceae bacterium]